MALPHISHNKIHVNFCTHMYIVQTHTHTHASKSHHWSEIRKKILFLCLHLPKRQKLKSTQKNNRTTRNEKGLMSMGNWWMAKYNLSAIFHMFFLYIQCRKVVHGTCVSHWKLLTVLVHLSCFDNTLRALIFNNTPYCFHFETNWIKSKSLGVCKLNQVKVFLFSISYALFIGLLLLCSSNCLSLLYVFLFFAHIKCNYLKNGFKLHHIHIYLHTCMYTYTQLI